MNLYSDINRVGNWVFNKMNDRTWSPVGRIAFGRVKDEQIQWGIVYERFTGMSVYAHIAIDNPASWTEESIRLCFHYPFIELGVYKILVDVSSGNKKSLKLAKGLGFQEESRIEGVYNDGDLVILSITLDQCKWLKETEHGRRKQRTTTT